jgi:hypothetical protein
MYFPVPFFLASLFLLFLGGTGSSFATSQSQESETAIRALRVSNHYPFAIRESLHFQMEESLAVGSGSVLAVSHSVTGGTVEAHYLPVQADRFSEEGRPRAWIDVQLRPGESRVYNFQQIGGSPGPEPKRGAITASFSNNLPQVLESAAGALTEWIDFQVVRVSPPDPSLPDSITERMRTGVPVAFDLIEERHGMVRTVLVYRSASTQGQQDAIEVRYHLYASGITDIEVTVYPAAGDEAQTSLVVAQRIVPPATGVGAVRQQGQVVELAATKTSTGPVNWLAWGNPGKNGQQAILAALDAGLIQVENRDEEWFMVSKIDQPIGGASPSRLSYRLLPTKDRSLAEVDEAFIAFVGHRQRVFADDELHVGFGLDAVQFGVTISVVGDATDAFQQDEIRRNMLIANALGIDWIRIDGIFAPNPTQNHLDSPAGESTLAHLGFLTESAREAGLGLLLRLALSPSDARLVAERFGDAIAFYEIDNTHASIGSNWEPISQAILSVQPQAILLLSRPEPLSEGVQAIGRELKIRPNEPVGIIKDASLSLAGEALRRQKMALVTDFTVGIDLRQTEESQANQLFTAYEALLAQRSLPFVFHSSFISTPTGSSHGKHLLRSDGTPTRKAAAFHEIIRRNSNDNHRTKTLDIRMPVVSIRPGASIVVPVTFTNGSSRVLSLKTRLHLPTGLTGDTGERTITLRPRQSQTLERTLIAAPELSPGFYHLFEEAHYSDTVRIGWTFAASRGRPAIAMGNQPSRVAYVGPFASLDRIDLSNIRHVIFGRDASELEVDWAVRLGHSLRRVTGTDIKQWSDELVQGEQTSRSHVLIGNQKTNPEIARLLNQLPLNPMELPAGEGAVMVIAHPSEAYRFLLVVSGPDAAGIGQAASDLMGRLPAGNITTTYQ